MALNENEFGSVITVDMGRDVSTNIGLEVALEPELGDEKIFTQSDGVTVGSVNITEGDETFLANTYLQYTLKDGDLDFVGPWRKRGRVKVDPANEVVGNFVQFQVLP